MKIHPLFLTLLFPLITGISACNKKQPTDQSKDEIQVCLDSLNHTFESINQEGHLPGFSISIFTTDSVLFQKGFGYANEELEKPMNPQTIQCVASISKTLISVCLMNAVEKGLLSLETPINDLLPFKVINPRFPQSKITIRQLATHTSSISDDANYDKAYVFEAPLNKNKFPEAWHDYLAIYNTNKPMSLGAYLSKVFAENSDWATSDNFLNEAPGTMYEYSNIGAGLLAYCIEIVNDKVDFKDITQELIFDPLQMDQSGWSHKFVDTVNHIAYYNENRNPVPFYNTNTYPDGGLFTSIADLTTFMQEMMRGYYGESSLLSSASFQTMMTNQIPDLDSPTGIIWDMDNDCCIGHGGNDFGIATMMFFNPDTGIGKILFSNISLEKDELADAYYGLFNTMFRYDKVFSQLQ